MEQFGNFRKQTLRHEEEVKNVRNKLPGRKTLIASGATAVGLAAVGAISFGLGAASSQEREQPQTTATESPQPQLEPTISSTLAPEVSPSPSDIASPEPSAMDTTTSVEAAPNAIDELSSAEIADRFSAVMEGDRIDYYLSQLVNQDEGRAALRAGELVAGAVTQDMIDEQKQRLLTGIEYGVWGGQAYDDYYSGTLVSLEPFLSREMPIKDLAIAVDHHRFAAVRGAILSVGVTDEGTLASEAVFDMAHMSGPAVVGNGLLESAIQNERFAYLPASEEEILARFDDRGDMTVLQVLPLSEEVNGAVAISYMFPDTYTGDMNYRVAVVMPIKQSEGFPSDGYAGVQIGAFKTLYIQ